MTNYIEIFNGLIVIIGLPTLVAFLINIGRKLQLLDSLEKTISQDILPELKELKERFIVVEDRVESIWKDRLAPQSSPRQLNKLGQNILINSGIKKIIDQRNKEILELLKENDIESAYDAEQLIMTLMLNLTTHFPEINDTLKQGAFETGSEIDDILFTGAIYARDQFLPKLGFTLIKH